MASKKATTPPAETVHTAVTRVIDLDPADWFLATWRKLEPLPRPQPAPFDHGACVARLERVTTASYPHPWNWHRAGIADALTPQEAHFWFAAMTGAGREVRPRELALHLSRQIFTGNLSRADIEAKLHRKGDSLPAEVVAVLANFLPPEKLVSLLLKLEADWGRGYAGWPTQQRIADGFARQVVPYLSAEQRKAAQDRLRDYLDPVRFMPHTAEFSTSCMAYRLAAALGMHAEIAALVDSWPRPCPSHQPLMVEVIFGLGDARRVDTVMRQLLGRSLSTPRSLRSWLAHTELSGLDLVRDSILHCPIKERAEEFLAIFCRVRAPEAAPLMLELRLNFRAPRLAREWLQREVGNGVAGLIPVAAGRGRIADAALDYLREVKARGFTAVIEEQLARAPSAVAGRVRRAVLAQDEKPCAVFEEAALPDWLRRGLEEARPRGGRLPGWLSVLNLPPLALAGRYLSADDVPAVLNALKISTLAAPHPLIAALHQTADSPSLDAFAWRLCELWLGEAAPARDKWALQATGLFGGDGCALKLASHVRTWAAERQRLRALLGLECLKAISSDTALMQLGPLARKLRYRTAREKAEQLLAEVAEERGLSREQLEDRIVPDLELDRQGGRTFDFGQRQFRMVLGPDFKPLLRDGAGKLRDDLPKPGVKDDRTKADTAVQEWRLLKKQLREALKVQAERLERAMIEGRRWLAGDFEKFLVGHPLLSNLVRLLLWGAFDQEGKLTGSFRLTEEKEYADAKDACFRLARSAAVGLVYPLHLSEQERAAWGEILADYEIIQPFAQLSRRVHTLHPGEEGQQLVTRFRGTEIEYRVAYGVLRSVGWASTWGNARFVRVFPGASLTAFLQADGPDLLSLGSLFFLGGTVHNRPDTGDALVLGEVDPVVLSEVLGAVSVVASKGRVAV